MAERWLNKSCASQIAYAGEFIFDLRDLKWTGSCTGQAADAFIMIHDRDRTAKVEWFFTENGRCPAGSGYTVRPC